MLIRMSNDEPNVPTVAYAVVVVAMIMLLNI